MRKRKQLLLSILLIISINLIFIQQMYAATGIIQTETIRLRKQASTNSTILDLISEGEKVEILSEEKEWYKVKYKGMTGYVSKEYVKVDGKITSSTPTPSPTPKSSATPTPTPTLAPTPTPEPTQEPNPTPEPSTTPDTSQEEQTGTITVGEIKKVKQTEKLYILPLIHYSSIYEITTSDTIKILQIVNNWAYVETKGMNGWVIVDRLEEKEETTPVSTQPEEEPTKQEEVTPTPEPTPQTNKTAYIKGEQVNFREKAKNDSEVIQTLKQNTKVEIIEKGEEWSKVKYNGKEGYVATRLLSDTKIEVTNRSAQPRTAGNLVVEQTAQTEELITAEAKANNKGSEIVAYAKQFLGCKYIYGGASPKGFDCSGFTQYVYKHFGYNIARTATAQSKNGRQVSKSELQLGDLVIFTPYNSNSGIGHVGIYIGDNQFIHASSEKTGVIISSLNSDMYTRRYVTARRILE